MAVFGMPGGAELLIIGAVLVTLGLPTIVVALVVWLVAANKRRSAPPVAPAAWLADPTGRHELRYWNGSAWTVHVADSGVQTEDAL